MDHYRPDHTDDQGSQPVIRSRQFAPVAPLNDPKAVELLPLPANRSECEDVIRDALRGVPLGWYDEAVCRWLAYNVTVPTLRTLVSLMERIREAGNQEAVDAENELRTRSRGVAPVQYGPHPGGGWLSGSCD